ncbi:MAG TPA: hypothetical protein VFW34_00295 [Candidatus Rubrimentiphilum sp.]|nr:hypothetical protein [Candidatus Rubrimentiphilum sp.]
MANLVGGFDFGILADDYGGRTSMELPWLNLDFSSPSPVHLTVKRNVAFIGDAPAKLAATLLHAPATIEYRGNIAAPLAFKAGLALKIAADRPQVFVIGAADNQRALQNGMDPTAAAIAFAARRAKMVAQLLGMSARYYSLVETYPPAFIGGERYIYSAGLAMTLEGQKPASWRVSQASRFNALPIATAGYVPIGIPDGDDLIAGDARSTVSVRLPSTARLKNVERQVTKRAMDDAIGMALSAARARHLQLNRLVLLIVSPLDIDGDPFAQTSVTMGQFFSVHVRVQTFFRAGPV